MQSTAGDGSGLLRFAQSINEERMRRIAGAGLIAAGLALLGWAGSSALRARPSYTVTIAAASDSARRELAAFNLAPETRIEGIEISTPDERRPIANGIVARESGRLTPLLWRNAVTEPILFADTSGADLATVLAAIHDHAPEQAIVLAWWDLSRAIRLVAKRDAPLDDPRARGLALPVSWTDASEPERARWGNGASAQTADVFTRFIEALTLPEKDGAAQLWQLANGRPCFIAVHISDIWKTAAAAPTKLSVAYKDFPSSGVSHGVIKSAKQWMQDHRVDGGFAAEPMGGATRLHYFQRKGDGDSLIAKLLPFSTSNPAQLENFDLVYQLKGYWIYKLKP
jgi:hydroxylamine oxidation protein HaoB